MSQYFAYLIMLSFLSPHGAFAVDRLGIEITTLSVAKKLEKGIKVPDECILVLFELLSPLDKENNKIEAPNVKERERIIESWKSYIINNTEDENKKVIEDFIAQVLILSAQGNASPKVLNMSFDLISQEYNK